MTYSPAVQAALADLAAAEDALGPFARIQFASLTLAAGGHSSQRPPAAKKIWLAVYDIVNSGATPARLDALVSVLRDVGSDVQLAFAGVAGDAIENDQPRAAVWSALRDLTWALGQE